MATDPDLERRLMARLHAELDREVGPRPAWAATPDEIRPGPRRWVTAPALIAAIVVVALATVGGVLIVGGSPSPSATPSVPTERPTTIPTAAPPTVPAGPFDILFDGRRMSGAGWRLLAATYRAEQPTQGATVGSIWAVNDPAVMPKVWIVGNTKITAFAIVAAFTLALFVWWEWRHPDPIVDLKLLKNRNFGTAVFLQFVLGMVLFGSTVLIPQFLQVLMGYTAERAGMALSPGALVLIVMMPSTRKLSKIVCREYGKSMPSVLFQNFEFDNLVWRPSATFSSRYQALRPTRDAYPTLFSNCRIGTRLTGISAAPFASEGSARFADKNFCTSPPSINPRVKYANALP